VIRQNVSFDYLYVSELAGLLAWFLEHDPQQKAYNVCRGEAHTLLELAGIVAAVSGCNPEIFVRNKALATEYSADNSLMLREIGGYGFRALGDSIGELYHWYKAHAESISVDQLTFDDSE
jgi:nucleoside-diphosphate-sugar epimerase